MTVIPVYGRYMKLKVFVRVFSLMLAINFAGEVIFVPPALNLAQVEIDFDSDSEKKESLDEKESDKIKQVQTSSRFENLKETDLISMHFSSRWISPTIEMSSPPPEVA